MKGIILAGGSGSRLYPVTHSISKQMLPVYDSILIITTPHDADQFRSLLGDGSQWGLDLQFAVQPEPEGLAQAFIIGRDFIGNDSVSLILGDNIFSGPGLSDKLLKLTSIDKGAATIAYHVSNPEDFGVVEFDSADIPVSIEEKPENPRSNWAITRVSYPLKN
jgi:glucose-1-phosphate thymidylyltransferase